MTYFREIARYTLDLVGVQEVDETKQELYFFLWKRE
jgi:hypothetical protein